MMEIGEMEALVSVARCGSVTAAADALHITPSAVSQRVAKLQRTVGQVLLERQGRGVRLTEPGEMLVSRIEQIMAIMDEAATELESYKGAVVGTVRVGGFASASRGLLPVALSDLRRDFPALHLEVHEHEPDVALAMLMGGDLDLAVVQDWDTAPLVLPAGLRKLQLLDDVVDVAIPATHPLADRESVTLDDLLHESWVTWPRGSNCHDWLIGRLRERGVEPSLAFLAAEYPTQLALVAAGFGLAVIPRLGRGPIPAGVRMVLLRPEARRHVYVVWKMATDRRPAIRAAAVKLRNAAASETVLQVLRNRAPGPEPGSREYDQLRFAAVDHRGG